MDPGRSRRPASTSTSTSTRGPRASATRESALVQQSLSTVDGRLLLVHRLQALLARNGSAGLRLPHLRQIGLRLSHLLAQGLDLDDQADGKGLALPTLLQGVDQALLLLAQQI